LLERLQGEHLAADWTAPMSTRWMSTSRVSPRAAIIYHGCAATMSLSG